jgi:hypothetical protein
MRTRTLGTELVVSAEGLGCMGMSDFYGTSDEQQCLDTIHRALDLGITFLDTADMYGPFTNERLVGRAIVGRRDEVVIATKFGNQRTADGAFLGINGRPEYVRAACDASLQRLDVEVIDLYYQHRVDRSVPVEETWGALRELVEFGQGPPPRHLRGLARNDPPRSRGRADHRGADRVVAVDARSRGERRAGGGPRAGHRLRAVLTAGPRLPQRPDPQHRRPRAR